MAYDSPKQIRRRQQARNDAPRKRAHQPVQIKVSSQEEWDRSCDFHLYCINERVAEGHADAAGRVAQSIVHLAVHRRAYQVMNALNLRSYWKALAIARHELLNVEVA